MTANPNINNSVDVLLYGLTLYECFRKGDLESIETLGINPLNKDAIEIYKSYTVFIEYLMVHLQRLTNLSTDELLSRIRSNMVESLINNK